MAELAAGAVSSLLSVIRSEAELLRGVRVDVRFIREEMESMNGFLAHLSRRAPPTGEHDEQVRAWMNQVRLLAQDCNYCIEIYLYHGDPGIHRARGGLRRYLGWVSWFLHKLVAQHRAAVELRELKDRARDIAERRLRYGVEVPGAGHQSLPALASGSVAAYDKDDARNEDQTVNTQLIVERTHHYGPKAFFESRTLDDYFKTKLLEWTHTIPAGAGETLSIAIVAPDADKHVLTLAQETLVVPGTETRGGYHRGILVNIPAVHSSFQPLRPKDILYYILRELKHAKSQSQRQDIDQSEGEDEELNFGQDTYREFLIYRGKKRLLHKIKEKIENMKIHGKLDKIKSELQVHENLAQKKGMNQVDISVLLKLLLHSQQCQVKNKDMQTIPVLSDNTIKVIAKKFKGHMEADEIPMEHKEKMVVKDTVKQEKEEDIGEVERKEEEEQESGYIGDKRKDEEEKIGEKRKKEKVGEGQRMEEEQDNRQDGYKREEDEKEEERGDRKKDKKAGDEEEEKVGYKREEVNENENEKEEEEEENDEVEEDSNEEEDEEDENEDEEEDDDEESPIYLHELQYEQILREVFPKISSSKPLQAQQQDRSVATSKIMETTLDEEERIKQIIHKTKQEVLRELQEGKLDKDHATDKPSVPDQNQEVSFEEITQMIEKIEQKMREQIKIKGIVDKIKKQLEGDCPLIVLKVDDMMDQSIWEEIRKALSLLDCSADVLIFTTTKSILEDKGFCYPPLEPIYYSLVGLYHDTVLDSTKKNKDIPNPHIFRDILEECYFLTGHNLEKYEPHEFCMKIFTHALHANPNRRSEELIKLHNTLQALPKSFDVLAKKMFMYSYDNLPEEYKSCLLYLAIFPKGQRIRRSTLIGRWVAERLIFKEDWPSSVRQANRCFDMLIDCWRVYPADIGAIGNVKSCVVGDLIHGFITPMARRKQFAKTQLSHHLARHFSIFNDVQLRSSDRIDRFFQSLSGSSRVSLLKVLDLEGCQCFGGKNQRYLKTICSKMILLKFLSLKGTDITQLPSEINYLRELEVLDIRQTKVPAYATVKALLLKLKRLLAGHIDPSSSDVGSVQIPRRIGKMVNLEVLYNVKSPNIDDLKEIGKLWQLRKLGVVIDDKDSQLQSLLQTISDLHECLGSLSITIPSAIPCESTPSSVKLPDHIASRLRQNPRILESLSIKGTTRQGHLLPLFIKGDNNKLAKVTLSCTPLNQNDLDVLAKLPKLQCVRFRHVAFTENMLTFKEGGFRCLKYLLVEGSDLTNITFEDGAACELVKLVLSSTSTMSISGADMLPKLEELELNNDSCSRLLSSFDNAEKIAKLTLRGALLNQDAIQILAKKPSLLCLVLSDISFEGTQNEITLKKDEFTRLNLLDVGCSSITKIVFTTGSAPRLERIIWSSFTSLYGIYKLPRLKELEFKGYSVPEEVKEDISTHKNKLSLKYGTEN